jgi:hypothetical protein
VSQRQFFQKSQQIPASHLPQNPNSRTLLKKLHRQQKDSQPVLGKRQSPRLSLPQSRQQRQRQNPAS